MCLCHCIDLFEQQREQSHCSRKQTRYHNTHLTLTSDRLASLAGFKLLAHTVALVMSVFRGAWAVLTLRLTNTDTQTFQRHSQPPAAPGRRYAELREKATWPLRGDSAMAAQCAHSFCLLTCANCVQTMARSLQGTSVTAMGSMESIRSLCWQLSVLCQDAAIDGLPWSLQLKDATFFANHRDPSPLSPCWCGGRPGIEQCGW